MKLPLKNNICLRLTDVGASYDGKEIFKNLSLEVGERDYLAVTGANGCGKTTLMRIILGLKQPTMGTVEYFSQGHPVSHLHIGYLPQMNSIDSKFPMEDYSRLVSASEEGNIAVVEQSRKALEVRIKDEAKAIKNYIAEPYTTPFAVMYLATEGLYAEIMNNRNGLPDKLRSMGILVAGPGTITAMLSSLQLGFSTIAINKKANEVFKILGNAKKQYDMFGDLLIKAKKKIDEAGSTIEQAQKRNDIIQKNLKSVNSLDSEEVNYLD